MTQQKTSYVLGGGAANLAGGEAQPQSQPAGTARGSWNLIAAWSASDAEAPVPVVMSVELVLSVNGQGIDSRFTVSPASGVGGAALTLSPLQGALRVVYGANGVTNEREIDIQSGAFQLPPCSHVSVYWRTYNESLLAPPSGGSYSLRVSLSGGVRGEEFAFSSGDAVLAGGDQTLVNRLPVGGLFYQIFLLNYAVGLDVQLNWGDSSPPYYYNASTGELRGSPDIVPPWLSGFGIMVLLKTGTDAAVVGVRRAVRF